MNTVEKVNALGPSVAQMSEAEVSRAVGVSRERIRQVKDRLKYRPASKYDNPGVYTIANERAFTAAMMIGFDRFQLYYEEGDPNECWLWKGSKTPEGYGVFGRAYTHRIAYERAYGPIPDGMEVCHTCDTPSCVSPKHLFAGTSRDNTWDSLRKRRFKPFGKPISDDLLSLTRENVQQIRDVYRSARQVVLRVTRGLEVVGVPRGCAKALATQLRISNRLVSAIGHGKAANWV